MNKLLIICCVVLLMIAPVVWAGMTPEASNLKVIKTFENNTKKITTERDAKIKVATTENAKIINALQIEQATKLKGVTDANKIKVINNDYTAKILATKKDLDKTNLAITAEFKKKIDALNTVWNATKTQHAVEAKNRKTDIAKVAEIKKENSKPKTAAQLKADEDKKIKDFATKYKASEKARETALAKYKARRTPVKAKVVQ